MELITSLILLVVLIVPPLILAGKGRLTRFFSKAANALFGKPREVLDSADHTDEPEWETVEIYDGMITVEIPVFDKQVVAYDPVLEADFVDELEIINSSSKASSA